MMQKIGSVYLILFGCDAALAVVASFVEPLAAHSNILSTIVIIASLIVLILSIINKLQPKKVFLLLSIGYLVVSIFVGTAIGVLLVIKVGAEGVPLNVTPQYLSMHFTWYWPVHWVLVIFLCVLAFVGIKGFMKTGKGAEPSAAANRR
jgi:hypothetical protein